MLKRFWRASIIILLLLIALAYGGVEYTSRPQFCARCHEMKANYQSWQHGIHKNVNCLMCHVNPGEAALVKRKITAAGEVVAHVTGNYRRPIRAHVNPDNCLRCHSGKDKDYLQAPNITLTSGPGAPAFPHTEVIAGHVSCLQCHPGAAHGTQKPGS
ncbi:MAG: cytochrome c3 family protein [Methylocystaceae bacterium]